LSSILILIKKVSHFFFEIKWLKKQSGQVLQPTLWPNQLKKIRDG